MRLLELTQGYTAKISDIDFEWASKLNWFIVRKQYKMYAKTSINGNAFYLHRLITKMPYIDHVDGDGLNNQRENLRPATKSQNMANRGLQKNNQYGLKGISVKNDQRRSKPWFARIKVNNKQIYLGCYKTKVDAAIAYNDAATKYFGEFAHLNPID